VAGYQTDFTLSQYHSSSGLSDDSVIKNHRPWSKESHDRPIPDITSTEAGHYVPLLIVEDDESSRIALHTMLAGEGYIVTSIIDGRDILSVIEEVKPTIILLDVVLPYVSGIEVCKQIRSEQITIPIIMLSSKYEEEDIVLAMQVGADDYLAKPYRIRELIARINVLLRRAGAPKDNTGRDKESFEDTIRCGEIVLDQTKHEVTCRSVKLNLALREFQLLRELLLAKGKVVERDSLMLNIWGFCYEGDQRIIATLINRLRAKIEEDPENPRHIITIRGVGYRLDE